MATLVRSPLKPRAILAPHVALQFMDWHGLWSAQNVQRHRLMRVATEAFHLEIEVTGIKGVAQRHCGIHASTLAHSGRPEALFSEAFCTSKKWRMDELTGGEGGTCTPKNRLSMAGDPVIGPYIKVIQHA